MKSIPLERAWELSILLSISMPTQNLWVRNRDSGPLLSEWRGVFRVVAASAFLCSHLAACSLYPRHALGILQFQYSRPVWGKAPRHTSYNPLNSQRHSPGAQLLQCQDDGALETWCTAAFESWLTLVGSWGKRKPPSSWQHTSRAQGPEPRAVLPSAELLCRRR